MIRCAFFEMKRWSRVTPRCTSDSISSISEPGSTTTPQPMTLRQPGCRIPDGTVCSTYFSRPTTTVWPALLPPANRATTLTWGVRMSTTFPLPSSPHCVPTTTMLGMAVPLHLGEVPFGPFQDVADRQGPLTAADQVQRQQRVGGRPRAADHQHVARPLGARVGQRLLEPAADDVAGDRGAAVAQAAGQREGGRLL